MLVEQEKFQESSDSVILVGQEDKQWNYIK